MLKKLKISEKSFKKATSMFLVGMLLFSIFVFTQSERDNEMTAKAVTLPSGISVLDKISDQDTSNFTFTNAPDIATATNTIFVNTPANDGRVWTDKSVNATQAFIYDNAGGVVDVVSAPDDEFLVTLSALSQSINTSEIIIEPSDTVIIIDVSGSMASNTVPGDGRSRIAVVIDALNDAIVMLMGANPDNRVSVVIYGGQSVSSQNQAKTYPVLALGRYVISQPIFSVSGTTVTVNSAVANPLQRTFTVEGGTPTQLGMRRGADMLLAVPAGLGPSSNGTDFDTGIPDPSSPGNNVIVTRKPNIILMTDGEPTYAWLDHTMSNFSNWQGVTTTANWYDVGNGSAGDMGLTALTVMTAAYVKQQVRDHYYGTLASNPENASRSVGFYTLGLGVNSSIANAMLDPYGKTASGQTNAALVTQSLNNVNYNMLDVLNNFTTGPAYSSGSFPYLNRGSGTARTLTTRTNTGGFITTCNYDTMAFTAMDKAGLDDAFNQITQQIVTQGNYTTNVQGNEQYDGYLAFSDVIGEYVEFSGFVGLWYDNVKNSGSSFASGIASQSGPIYNGFIENLQKFLTYPSGAPISQADAIAVASTATGNMVTYYADTDRNFLGITPPATGAAARVDMYTVQGPAVDALDGVTGVDLMLLVFQVVNVLEAGPFNQYFSSSPEYLVSNLQPGDQIVRWYIPASLIPLREVQQQFNTDGSPIKDDFGNDVVQVVEAAPLRVMYTVAPNVNKIQSGLTALYAEVNPAPGENSYYFYTNRWRGTDGKVVSNAFPYDQNNMSLAAFSPSNTNTFYQNVWTRNTQLKSPNVTGPTGTSPWCWRYTQFTANPTVEVQNLGNNGRIMIRSQTELTINKTFTPGVVIPPSPEYMLTMLILGTDAAGNDIFRATLNYPDDFTNDSVTVNIPPGNYVIHEMGGYLANYMFMSPSPIMVGPVTAGSRVVDVFNSYMNYTPRRTYLIIRKMFSGLLPPGDPNTEIPQNFAINVTHLESGTEWGPFDLTQVMGGQAVIPPDPGDLVPGTYRISESNYLVDGFTWESRPTLPFDLTIHDTDIDSANHKQILFLINNRYTPIPDPTYTLNLNKVINGLENSIDIAGNPSVPQGLVFKLEKTDAPTFLQTIRWEDLTTDTPITGLPAGTYTLTELGGTADGFFDPNVSLTMNGVPVQNGFTFTLPGNNVDANNNITFTFTNTYTPIPPPPPPESLVVRKLLNFPAGTTGAQIQQSLQQLRNQGFEIVVTGPAGFSERIGLDAAIAGAVFEDVASGNYTFNENNAALPGYTFTSNPALPFTVNIEPDLTDAVTVEITNVYTTIPPPQPPSPQTGVTRNTVLPGLILFLAGGCIIGAEVYRRKAKKRS